MRILLVSVGSRGDAEPFCSLAATLAKTDGIQSVELFLQSDLEYLVPTEDSSSSGGKIHFHALPFTQMDFYKYAGKPRTPPQAGAGHENPRVQFLGVVTDIMGELVLPCYSRVLKVVQDNGIDVIVASSLSRQLALEVALQVKDTKKIPVYLVQLQSLVPTRDYPHYSQTEACVDALSSGEGANTDRNLETFLELERFQHEFLQVHPEQQLANADGYQPGRSLGVDAMLSALQGHPIDELDIWMVNAVSTAIVPATSDSGPRVLNVGGLAYNYIPHDFQAPSELVSFLKRHEGNERPICFGFGSMPFGKAQLLVEAAYEAKRPSILVGSAMMQVLNEIKDGQNDESSDSKKAWIRDHIVCLTNIPYPWLLPLCSMMFSHGGAGVLHSTLRAGIPACIAPFLGDQFFFAPYVEAKGLGVKVCENLAGLTKENVLESIPKADACQEACRELGKVMAKGEASDYAASNGPDILALEMLRHRTN